MTTPGDPVRRRPGRDGARARRRIGAAAAGCAAFVAALFVAAAPASSAERNPFEPPQLSARLEFAEKDRVARITQEVLDEQVEAFRSELQTMVDSRVREGIVRQMISIESRVGVIEDLAQTLQQGDAAGEGGGASGSGSGSGSSDVAGGSTDVIPAGSVFVACVNGKALYRDVSGNTFFSNAAEPESGIRRCNG